MKRWRTASMKRSACVVALAVAAISCGGSDPKGDAGSEGPKGAPIRFTFEAVENRSFASFGWTGIIHNLKIAERTAFGVQVVNCDKPDGNCRFEGPIDPVSPVKRRRCLNRMAMACTADAECPDDGTSFRRCAYIYDPPAPIPQAGAGGLTGACGFSYIPLQAPGVAAPIVGTMDMTSGELNLQNLTVNIIQNGAQTGLTSGTFRGGCMECVSDPIPNDGLKQGTCMVVNHPGQGVDPSPEQGASCDVHRFGSLPEFSGNYSMDCSPSVRATDTHNTAFGGTFTSSGFQVAITDNSPRCTDPDYAGERCFCGMCPDNITACLSNADCGGQQCGFLPAGCDPQPAPLKRDGTPNPLFMGPFAPEQCRNGAVGAATRPNSCQDPGCIWDDNTGQGTCKSTLNGKIVGCYPSGSMAKVTAPGRRQKIGSVWVVDTGNARCTRIQSAGVNGLLGLPGLTFQKRSFRIIPEYAP
jgi:hypothetical protein